MRGATLPREGPCEASDSPTSSGVHLTPEARARTAAVRAASVRALLVAEGIITPRPCDYDEATAHQAAAEARLEARGVPTLRIDTRGRRSVRRPRLQWDPLVELGGAPEHHQRGAR